MFKKLLSLLLVLLLCFLLVACSSDSNNESSSNDTAAATSSEHIIANPNPEKDGSTPLLYKISDKDGNYCYLFGTVHIGEDWMYPLPDYVLSAIDDADSIALEIDTRSMKTMPNLQIQ